MIDHASIVAAGGAGGHGQMARRERCACLGFRVRWPGGFAIVYPDSPTHRTEGEMSPQDLATVALLDPDQGVCPNGHRCVAAEPIGARTCEVCGYRGRALICWEITPEAIDAAEAAGAAVDVVAWARSFVLDRS
jgi:hypothetical protein